MIRRIHGWDVRVFLRLNQQLIQSRLPAVAHRVSHTADGWFYLLAPAICLLIKPELVQILFPQLALAFAAERAGYLAMKKGFKRRRPPKAIPGYSSRIIASDEFSFPSGHTSGAFLFATSCALVFGPFAALLFIWAAAVGASRVILGVHFPTDIFMGALMGSSIALFTASQTGLL